MDRRGHVSKSRVESGGIFDPALSSIFSARLYLVFPNKKPMGILYPSQKHHPLTPSVLALMLAMAGTRQLPTSSTQ